MNKKTLQLLQIISLCIAIIFVILSIYVCVRHMVWTKKGVEVNAYVVENNEMTFVTKDGQVLKTKVPNSAKAEPGEFIKIYYNAKKTSYIYYQKNISHVFIYSGIAIVGIAGALITTLKLSKEPTEENKEQE